MAYSSFLHVYTDLHLFVAQCHRYYNAMPCYSHASHISSDTDSNSKSSGSSLGRSGASSSDISGNSQQRRVAVYKSWCNKGLKIWSLSFGLG